MLELVRVVRRIRRSPHTFGCIPTRSASPNDIEAPGSTKEEARFGRRNPYREHVRCIEIIFDGESNYSCSHSGMAACILRTISFAQVYFVNGAAVEDPSKRLTPRCIFRLLELKATGFDGIIRINMLTALEPTAYLIAACLPVIGGMFVRLDNTQHWRTYHDPVIRLRSLPNINAGSGAG